MSADIFSINPHTGIAVHTVKPYQYPVSRKVFRYRNLTLVIILIVCQDVEALHKRLSRHFYVFPVSFFPFTKIKILVLFIGCRNSPCLCIIRNIKQISPSSVSRLLIQADLSLFYPFYIPGCIRNHRCIPNITAYLCFCHFLHISRLNV